MNDEIKDIINYLFDKDSYIEELGIAYKRIYINNGDLKLLLDYITNLQHTEDLYNQLLKDYDELQQENERLKELCDKYEEEHSNEFQCWKRDRKELLDKRARIEKAVEYIEHSKFIKEQVIMRSNYDMQDFQIRELLNILNGRSDE